MLDFFGLLCVGNEVWCVRPVRKKRERKKKTQVLVITTRWFRSSAVLIMSQENHSVIRHFCQKSTKQGLRPPRRWFVVVAGGVAHIEIPTTQRFHRHSCNLKITQWWRTFFLVKNIFMGLVF